MMDQKELFRKIGEIVNELNDQYKYLAEHPDKMKEVEMELFKANANFLADHIRIVQKLGAAGPSVEITHAGAELLDKIIVPSTQSQSVEVKVDSNDLPQKYGEQEIDVDLNLQESIVEEQESHIDNAEPKEIHLKKTKFILDEPAEDMPQHEEISKEPLDELGLNAIAKETNESSRLAPEYDVFEDPSLESIVDAPKLTVNDVLSSQQRGDTLAGKYTREPVADLKSIINLNDKLLFVKDLFKGYSLAYSEAIEILNRFESFDAADNFLKTNYALKNNWADKQAAADKFYEMLNRRFTK